LKDLVKSGGEWNPAVAEAAVIAVPDERWSERPLALLVLKPGNSHVSASDIQDHLRPRFAKWMVPDHIEFVTELPRTSVGKLNKLALRHQYTDSAR
jgi:fatty-acyl-CoA synthase